MSAYRVILSDGNRSILIPPRQVSENIASIPLVGKDLAGYGNIIATAQLRMLENFASPTPPSSPLEGQLWFDKNSQQLRVYTVLGTWDNVGEPPPSTLNELDDVSISSPQEGDYLIRAATHWENQQLDVKFTDLPDTPVAYEARQFLRVKADETGLEFVEKIPAGDISGTFNINQMPLQQICDWLKNNCNL